MTYKLIEAHLRISELAIKDYRETELNEIKNIAAYHINIAAISILNIRLKIHLKSNIHIETLKEVFDKIDNIKELKIPVHIIKKASTIDKWRYANNRGMMINVSELNKVYTEVNKWFEGLKGNEF